MEPHYIAVSDCHDYLKQVNCLPRRGWIYRGHSVSCARPEDEDDPDKNWRLITSVHRFINDHGIDRRKRLRREDDHVSRFKSTAKGFLHCHPDDDDVISWLGLMQHFGYPTRLLDFTFNPAVALYFALENASPKTEYAGIHALHIDSIRHHTSAIRRTKELLPKQSDYGIGGPQQKREFLGISPGRWSNERQEAQEGVFLVSSEMTLDIERWLKSMPRHGSKRGSKVPSNWIKYAIPIKDAQYYDRLKELKNIGLGPHRIYPGLLGVCGYYKWSWFDQVKTVII